MMENRELNSLPTSFINKASISTKNSPIKASSAFTASETKIGFIKSQSIYPKQLTPFITTPLIPSHSECSTSRGSKLTQICLTNHQKGQDSKFKENRSSRERIESSSKECISKIDDSKKANLAIASQNFIKKISSLEVKIKELSKENQQIAKQLNNKIKKLEEQNNRLSILVRNSCKQKVPDLIAKNGEFNLEEMLSAQINLNLQLREKIEKMSQQMIQQTKKCSELQISIQFLQAKDKEKENIQAERSVSNMEKKKISQQYKEKLKENQVLKDQLSLLNAQNSQLKSQAETLRQKIIQYSKQQCKKCKDLLHTIFRLNSQLNKI